jgi:hypothetical protein
MGRLPSRDPARTAKHKDFNLYIFLQQGEFNVFGLKWQIVLRLVPKQKNQKMHFKITVKMLQISQDPWAACKTWSSNEFFSAAVLKQRKRPQLKIQTKR